MENTQLFNYISLLTYVRENTVLAKKIQILLLEELPKEMLEMDEAMKNQDWETVSSVAHKIKPNIQMYSNQFLFELVFNLEQDGKNNKHIDTIPLRVEELKKYTTQLIAEITENLAA